jgi:hypothetical protein
VGAAQALRGVAVAALLAVAGAAAGAPEFVVEGSCRDGQPHGAYEARMANGQVRIVGAFNRGKRTGSFMFWSSAGVRIAQLPYADDALSGTVALWYADAKRRDDARPKLEATYVHGRMSGLQRSWYPNGRPRAEYRYEQGTLAAARVFGESGQPLAEAVARAQAVRDRAEDEKFFAALDAIVRANLPRCDPATDRLERGS